MAIDDAGLSDATTLIVTPARFPAVARADGHYESVYLKACHPDGGLGVWIRYTVHKRPGEAPKGYVWFTLFDAESGVVASKAATAAPAADREHLIRLGENAFAPGRVRGTAPSPQLDAAWDLSFTGREAPVWHFPRPWMYTTRLPRTKVLSPYPGVRVSGRLQAGARSVEVDAWPGTVGHNWGSEHAQRAIWIHGANFAGHEDAWLDLAIGRVKLGPATTPWVANGVLFCEGRRYRLGGPRHLLATSIAEAHERCRFRVAGADIRVSGDACAPTERFVGWSYAQPSGQERQTINCSIADLRLEVDRPGSPGLELEVCQAAAYELQMAERSPRIPLQPFVDG
jgi:hypothetical protein